MSQSLHGIAQRLSAFEDRQRDELTTFKREQREKMIQLGNATVQHMQASEDRSGAYTDMEASTRRAFDDYLRDLLAVVERAVYRQHWWQVWRPRRPRELPFQPVDPMLGASALISDLQNPSAPAETAPSPAFDAVGAPLRPPGSPHNGRHG